MDESTRANGSARVRPCVAVADGAVVGRECALPAFPKRRASDCGGSDGQAECRRRRSGRLLLRRDPRKGEVEKVSEIWWSQRPNKFVDRRLFAELLAKVDATRPLKEHAYISMGGPFLDDFPIIQSAVHLRSMMSIDREDGVRDRAEYNKPYSRVFCELADSSVLVSKFGSFADKLGA